MVKIKKQQGSAALTDEDRVLLTEKGLGDHLEDWPAFRDAQKDNNSLFAPLPSYYLLCNMEGYIAHTTAGRAASKPDTTRAAWVANLMTTFLPLFGVEDTEKPLDSKGRRQYRLPLPGRQRIDPDVEVYHIFSVDPSTSIVYPDPQNGDDDDNALKKGKKTKSKGIKKVSVVYPWCYTTNDVTSAGCHRVVHSTYH